MAVECTEFCDLPSSRIMDQSAARYNDRSGFANNAAQDGFNHMTQIVTVEALNSLEMHGLANALLQLRSIQGQPGAP